ncbi:hypothetical protein MLD38_012275 [Melastoma candidum]|uniref:Uncharacterized protein n=1 Tax=Melastoma candidum TaxID=119954 RepID=A0ACB9R5T4_9MYRT|nr:hypothetical protein MLD38_012275 [Melastoma candidum]
MPCCEPISKNQEGFIVLTGCKRAEAKVWELSRKVVLAEKKLDDFLNSGKYGNGGKNLEGERAKALDSRVCLSGQDKSNNDGNKEANKDRASQLSELIHNLPDKTNGSKDLSEGHLSEKGSQNL